MVTSKHEQNIYMHRCAATAALGDLLYFVQQQWFPQPLHYIYTTVVCLLSLTLLHSAPQLCSYDDTAFASTPAAFLAVSKAGIMPLNYSSYNREIRSEPRHYRPCVRNLSNLHRPCADFSIPNIWILLRGWKEKSMCLQDLVFERENSEFY